MSRPIVSLTTVLAIATLAAMPHPGAAQDSGSMVTSSNEVATVVDIDYDSRRVLLKEEDGDTRVVVVSKAAPKLENVKEGDAVQVSTLTRTVAQLARAGEASGEAGVVMLGERDELPARDDIRLTRQVVTVLDVTRDGTVVRYRETVSQPPTHTIVITNDSMKQFAKSLKNGDRVAVDTLEEVVISTLPK